MYYFAYASNLSRKQMLERCPNNKPKFVATLPNHKLIFSGWSRKWHGGTASIQPTTGEKIIGAVYEVTEGCLANLEKHEGLKYRRKPAIVFTESGESVEVVTFIMREQSEETKPTMEYLAIIQQGYRDWGII